MGPRGLMVNSLCLCTVRSDCAGHAQPYGGSPRLMTPVMLQHLLICDEQQASLTVREAT